MARGVEEQTDAPPRPVAAPAAAGHRVDRAAGVHPAAVLSRAERTERRRRARRTATTRLSILAGSAVAVVLAAVVALGHVLGGSAPSTPTPPAAAAAPSSSASPSSPPLTAGRSRPSASSVPAPQRSVPVAPPASSASRTTASEPSGADSAAPSPPRAATPAAAPTSPVVLRATDPRGRATELLASFDRLVAAAVPGALVATARLGEDVAAVPTGLVGPWGSGRLPNGLTLAANHDAALRAGKVVARPALPTAAGTAVVRTPGAAGRRLPLLSPAQTLTQLQRAGRGSCARCAPVVVTRARPTRIPLATTRGAVSAPAWEFTVAGTKARLVRPALAPSALVQVAPPHRAPLPRAVGATLLPLWQVTVGADGRTVAAAVDRLAIAERPGCWRLHAVESRSGVALFAAKGKAGATGACATPAGRVSVRLAAPLGARTLLDTYWQRAIPAKRAAAR